MVELPSSLLSVAVYARKTPAKKSIAKMFVGQHVTHFLPFLICLLAYSTSVKAGIKLCLEVKSRLLLTWLLQSSSSLLSPTLVCC